MKEGQRVKAINIKLSNYGVYGTIVRKKVTTLFGEMIEVKFDNGISGLYRKESLQTLITTDKGV